MDIYAEVRLLAAALAQNGMTTESDEILSALQEGSTATEILMIVRHRIRMLKNRDLVFDLDILRRSKLIIDEINQVCG